MMDFLYFPEDKTDYIPSLFMMAIFAIAAILVFRIIIKASKKEEKQIEQKYSKQMLTSEKDKGN
ncbi:hypothetical protein [Salirhabdus sp. Marseille-P4669]|uniref:hypothetical protein n=1 Tax=Salirhabdus sp. Marseille-P4669 TaxID=2042310 RepID=UPI000C7AFB4E|nr:hypothetical protein [Salirhabdus sp. Marseille-P4669]